MEETRDSRIRARRILIDSTAVILSAVVGLTLASAIVRTHVDVGPLSLTARIAWGWPGQSSLEVPPFGTASAKTHLGPARLVVSVDSVDLPGVERLLSEAPPTQPSRSGPAPSVPELRSSTASVQSSVSEAFEEGRRSVGQDVAGLALLSAFVAAGFAALIAFAARRRWRLVGASAVLAFSIVVGSVAVAATSFDTHAFAEPRLEGALASVPRLATVFTSRVESIERLRDQAAAVARQLAAYYANPRSIVVGGGLSGTYRVLHVSDLHLDPVGAELARSLVRSYDVSLVIDTGDAAVTGRPAEAVVLRSLVVTSVPVVYVPGNHDSAVSLASLGSLPNVTIATTSSVTIDGINIVPLPDPQHLTLDIEPDRGRVVDEAERLLERLRTEAEIGLPPPDIIATHNPAAEKTLAGLAPLILSGHTHSGRLYVSAGSVRLNSGTLGGMPYDPETSQRASLPHSASVLYYTAELPRRLVAIDRISVSADRTTTMTRHIIDEALLPERQLP